MIPQGYKQTEIGIIPEDWDIKNISQLGEVVTGSTPSRDILEYWNGYFNWISAIDFSSKYIDKTHETLTDLGKKQCRILPEGCVLVTCIASIGLNAIAKTTCATNQQINAVICNKDVHNEYLYYQICNQKQALLLLAGQTAVPIISKRQFQHFSIAIPSIEEQRRIAEVLSDVDGLIAALDKKIAKKKLIKQAAMQQLLTGKKRLQGFSGEWENMKLGDIANIVMGQSPSSIYYNTTRVGLPLIQGNADMENRKTIIRIYSSQITKKCDVGDIILSVRAPVGSVGLATYESCIGRGVCAIKYTNNYLYYYLIFNENNWEQYSKGSTFDSINHDELVTIPIKLPKSVAEQQAIATILSDMDAEISDLERKRDKYKLLKNGMMQKLLTGQIRIK